MTDAPALPEQALRLAREIAAKIFSDRDRRRAAEKGALAAIQEVTERAAGLQPCTAEDPNESDYERGRFDGIIEYATSLRKLEHLS